MLAVETIKKKNEKLMIIWIGRSFGYDEEYVQKLLSFSPWSDQADTWPMKIFCSFLCNSPLLVNPKVKVDCTFFSYLFVCENNCLFNAHLFSYI